MALLEEPIKEVKTPESFSTGLPAVKRWYKHLADVPRAFRMVAKKRNDRIQKLRALAEGG